MKMWLILWFFNLDGQYIQKVELPYKNRVECVQAAGNMAKKFVNKSFAISAFCVTDNHHKGLTIDPGVPMD